MVPPDLPSAPKMDGGGDARGLVLISSVVAQLVLPVLLGVWLDNRYGWSPWGLFGGTVIGLAAGSVGFWMLYRRANRGKQ